MTTCSKCGKQWSGHKIEHCVAANCHQSFASTTAGEKHRVGKHDVTEGPDRRRCLTPDEMLARGMVLNAVGLWTVAAPLDRPHYRSKEPTVPTTARPVQI